MEPAGRGVCLGREQTCPGRQEMLPAQDAQLKPSSAEPKTLGFPGGREISAQHMPVSASTWCQLPAMSDNSWESPHTVLPSYLGLLLLAEERTTCSQVQSQLASLAAAQTQTLLMGIPIATDTHCSCKAEDNLSRERVNSATEGQTCTARTSSKHHPNRTQTPHLLYPRQSPRHSYATSMHKNQSKQIVKLSN